MAARERPLAGPLGAPIAVVVCIGIGSIAGAFPPGEWYAALDKPPGTPPNWVFGPVWTVLYGLIGFALWRWWRAGGDRVLLTLFATQLLLNLLWSALFFGLNRVWLAAADLGLLWMVIAATMHRGWQFDRIATWLFLPYLAWVSYAFYLNAGIGLLNE